MRAISSVTFVGLLLPPTNCPVVSSVGLGKIPAFSRARAFGSIMHEGIVLFENGAPGVTPAGGTPLGQLAPSAATFAGALITNGFPFESTVGNTAPVPVPFASAYPPARATV